MNQLPNLICIARTLMAIFLALKVVNNPTNTNLLIFSFWLTWIIIILDGLDGIIARKLNATSDFGAFIDIACDRIVELTYLALFTTLHWIPLWVMLIFLTRGILIDGIRGLASKDGKTAFGEKSMMKNKVGYFITSSRISRCSYGGIKASAFAFMFLANSIYPNIIDFEMLLIYLATFFCVIRGIPVLIEGKRFFN